MVPATRPVMRTNRKDRGVAPPGIGKESPELIAQV
jgi:hypothetical protein